MSDKGAQLLDGETDLLAPNVPGRAGRFLRWLMRPASRWLRIPLALLLIVGGIVGFLPILGFWMVPLGLLLLAQDVPFLRRPTRRFLAWAARKRSERRDRPDCSK